MHIYTYTYIYIYIQTDNTTDNNHFFFHPLGRPASCLRNFWLQRAALLQDLRPMQDEIAGEFQGFLGEFEGCIYIYIHIYHG